MHTNKEYKKCHKKRHIFCFHNSNTSLNKGKFQWKTGITSSSDFKKKLSYVPKILVNNMFETGVTRKIMIDLGTIPHLIANHELIFDYYNYYSKYLTK